MRSCWLVASAAALAGVFGPVGQALAEEQNPSVVIAQLQLAGYTVNVDRVGSAPIEDCTVLGVRNPQQVTQPVRVADRDGHPRHGEVIDVVVRQSISVSLDCTG